MIRHLTVILPVAAGWCATSFAEEAPPAEDPGWPREVALVEIEARTLMDQSAREVKRSSTKREVRCLRPPTILLLP